MRRLAAAALVAAALLLATPLHATATSRARIAAAVSVSRQIGHHGMHGPALDRMLVIGAWRDAGVDIRGFEEPDGLLRACTLLDPTAPRPAGPAPGDYALYRDSAGVERVGMFLSQLDVAIVDGDTVTTLPYPELNGEIGELTQEHLVAERGSLRVCRLAAWRWRGGVDDTAITAGRIALADPSEVSAHLQWAADHPRDADQGFLHSTQRILAWLAATPTAAVSSLIDSLVSAVGWLLRHVPFGIATPLLAVAAFLGRSFDGRRLHAVLTGIVVAVMAVALGLGWVLPFGWVMVGAVLGGAAASAEGVPVLGAVGGAMVGGAFAVGSFLAGALTGVDNSDRVTIGTVGFALLADLFMLRPTLTAIGAATRAGRFGVLAGSLAPIERLPVIRGIVGHGRSALDIAGTAGDALGLRPTAIVESTRNVGRGIAAVRSGRLPAVASHVLADELPMHQTMTAAEALMSSGRRGVDLLSLAWRPSSISSDLVGHAADVVHVLDTELRAGLPSMPRLRALLTSMDPAYRTPLLDSVAHVSTHAVPELRVTARLSHLHSGARTLMGIATHTQPQRPWTRLARSPIVRRAVRGLPGGRP